MLNPDFCLAKAEECELLADEAADAAQECEWRQMAWDWRTAARMPAADSPPPRGKGTAPSAAVEIAVLQGSIEAYRRKAEEAERLAGCASSPIERRSYEKIARSWRDLVVSAEATSRGM